MAECIESDSQFCWAHLRAVHGRTQRQRTLDFLKAPAATPNLHRHPTVQESCWAHMCAVHGRAHRERLTVHNAIDQMLMHCILHNIEECGTATHTQVYIT